MLRESLPNIALVCFQFSTIMNRCLTPISVYHRCSAVPRDFITRKSKSVVENTIRTKYGNTKHSIYRSGNVHVSCPLHAKTVLFKKSRFSLVARASLSTLSSLRFIFPDFLVKQFGNIISVGQMKELLTKWQAFIDTGVSPKGRKHDTRSMTPAFHFGVWRRYKKTPFITSDTKSKNCHVQAASHAFLTLLRNRVASKIATLTEYYAPKVWKIQSKCVPSLSFPFITFLFY
jgi:hypothetical protein